MCKIMCLIMSFCLVLCLVNDSWAELVGHWTFDEGTGTTASDSSGNGYDGTLIAGASWAPGKIGGAVNFNHVGCVDIPVGWLSSIIDQITIAWWAKGGAIEPTNTTMFSTTGVATINDPTDGLFMDYYGEKMSWRAPYPDQAGYYPSISQYKEWNHYAYTKDRNTGEMKLYMNGSVVNATAGNFLPMVPTGAPFVGWAYATIGGRHGGAGGGQWYDTFYNGMLDDVRIYNTVLSESEINALIPEPATLALLSLGGLGLLRVRRRR
jgi:hypothetical protein